jgi:hypothetical protein
VGGRQRDHGPQSLRRSRENAEEHQEEEVGKHGEEAGTDSRTLLGGDRAHRDYDCYLLHN